MDRDTDHRSADIEGVRMHWVDLGDRDDRPPLLLLHGLNDCHLTWRDLAPALACDRRVLVPDLPGHGLSGRPDASYELQWYARIMARWLETLGVDAVDVVGHSFGGGVAQVMLLECPHRIRRLVLLSSGGLGREIAMSLRLASIPRVVERFGQPFMGPGTRLAIRATGDVLSKEQIASLSAMNAQSGSARAFARTVKDIIDWRGQRHSFFRRASEVAQLPPIAVFWGARDAIIPAAHARAFADQVEGIRLVIFQGAGHYPHHTQPDAFVAALRDFLDDPSAPQARFRGIRAGKSRANVVSALLEASCARGFWHRRPNSRFDRSSATTPSDSAPEKMV
ncbi:MAG: alpha/beta fold hydrolase [Myxococcota bacterium]|nr:alpha/beta fold hydrolase [Myxococcota bacterium]